MPQAISLPRAVVRAPADGYTLLLVNSGNAASAALYDKLNFDLLRDIAPVAGIIRAPLIIEVNSSIPVKTVPELIAYAKANPGRRPWAAERPIISPENCSR
jgi:tripartite-type tricarboxylate transporter receptor subunit TctC